MSWPEPPPLARMRTGGARFCRCVFQVNPFDHFARQGQTPPADAETRDATIIVFPAFEAGDQGRRPLLCLFGQAKKVSRPRSV